MFKLLSIFFFFFNDTATTEIYTLSLHDALPIFTRICDCRSAGNWSIMRSTVDAAVVVCSVPNTRWPVSAVSMAMARSEEHTSELQSQSNLVCRLLLEKKKLEQKWSEIVHETECL